MIVNAIETYALETGSIPAMDAGLEALTQTPPGRGEPYLRSDKLTDPWGHPYLYVAPGPSTEYQVLSYGADGRPGGEGEAADVSSDDLARTTTAGAP